MSKPEIIPLDQHPQLANVVPDYVGGIGINQTRLERLALLGCFDPDVQFKVESGEATSYTTSIAGSIGNMALGTASGTRLPRLSHPDYDIRADGYMPTGIKNAELDEVHQTPKLTISINSTALQERVQADGNARDPKVWSRYLSESIGDGVTRAAWSHLVAKPHVGELILDGSITLFLGASMASAVLTSKEVSPVSLTGGFMSIIFGVNLFKGIRCYGDQPFKQACWSLVPMVHPDRVAVAAGLAKIMPVVRPLKP